MKRGDNAVATFKLVVVRLLLFSSFGHQRMAMAHGQTETEMESVHLVTKYKMGCCCGQCKKLMEAPVLRRVGFLAPQVL